VITGVLWPLHLEQAARGKPLQGKSDDWIERLLPKPNAPQRPVQESWSKLSTFLFITFRGIDLACSTTGRTMTAEEAKQIEPVEVRRSRLESPPASPMRGHYDVYLQEVEDDEDDDDHDTDDDEEEAGDAGGDSGAQACPSHHAQQDFCAFLSFYGALLSQLAS
jgi:hypothetical protein